MTFWHQDVPRAKTYLASRCLGIKMPLRQAVRRQVGRVKLSFFAKRNGSSLLCFAVISFDITHTHGY